MRKSSICILILLILFAGATVYAALALFSAQSTVESYERRDEQLAQLLETPPELWTAPQEARPEVVQTQPEVLLGAVASWKSPEGIDFISYVDTWDEAKLSELYTELMRNTVGPEIELVEQVTVNAASEVELVAGLQEQSSATYTIDIAHGALPDGFAAKLSTTASVIRLYDGDVKTDVSMMARTLSHEYGHHYTNYHLFSGAGDLRESEYVRLRGIADIVLTDYSDFDAYVENHKWYLQEIAAEDYVQLLGSPTVTQAGEFYDAQDLLDMQLTGDEPEKADVNICTNASPQENMSLPLAGSVDGLAEYMLSFAEERPYRDYIIELDTDIELSIEKKSESYDLERGATTYSHYVITWNAPAVDCLYTLVCYDADYDLMSAVRTVRSGADMTATVGTVTRTRGDYVYTLNDNLTDGQRIFLVTALSADGKLAVSKPLTYDFG